MSCQCGAPMVLQPHPHGHHITYACDTKDGVCSDPWQEFLIRNDELELEFPCDSEKDAKYFAELMTQKHKIKYYVVVRAAKPKNKLT